RQPDLALGRGRAELQPSPRGAAPQAKAVVGGGLLQLGADDEARRIFRARHDGYRPITLKPPLPLAVQARALPEAGSPVADAHPELSCSSGARFLHVSQYGVHSARAYLSWRQAVRSGCWFERTSEPCAPLLHR